MQTVVEWFTAGGLLAVVGLVFKNNKDNDDRVNRVYTRLDEVKKSNDDKYTSREVCGILHKQIKDDLTEIKTDVKILLSNGKVK